MSHQAFRILMPLAVGALLSSPAAAQITKVGSAYSFRIKLTAGTIIDYKMSVATSLSGMKVLFVNHIVQNIFRVKNGVGDVILKSGPLVVNGKPAGTQVVVRMSVDRRGTLTGGQTANSGITAFPQKPVLPGATWKAIVPMPTAGMTGSTSMVTTTYKFIKMTTYKGQKVAELGLSFRAGGQYKIDGDGTGYVLAKDGFMLHSTMTMRVSITANMEPATVNAEVNRV